MRREILIDSAWGETRAAVLEDDLLTEIVIERPGRRGISGNVYKGRVTTILPGMQSAFVDIGLERDTFLYVEDIESIPPGAEEWLDAGRDDPSRPGPARPEPSRRPAIEDLLKEGQEILVQVTKDPLGQKGARITCRVSLPGRFLVYLPDVRHTGVSRRIEDSSERERLRSLLDGFTRDLGVTGGFIVRTAGEGATLEDFQSDGRYLVGLWEGIGQKARSRPAPSLVHAEAGALGRVLRDLFHRDVAQVVVEGEDAFRESVGFMDRMEPALAPRIRQHEDGEPLFEERSIQQQIDRALRPRVWLKSGGSIVINQTEALVAIDVNTGKYVGTRRFEETILKTNLEAAVEIVRQVRLRDLGGIIVVDFIDMQEGESRVRVIEALERELRKDRSKSRMLQISEFGLVEITRQRTRPSLERLLSRLCPTCGGAGRLKSPETLYFEILRSVRRIGPSRGGGTARVHVHPGLADALKQAATEMAGAPDGRSLPPIRFEADPSVGHEEFRIVLLDDPVP